MSPMYEYTSDKTFYCSKCGEIRQNIYEPCLACRHKRITEERPEQKAHRPALLLDDLGKRKESPPFFKKAGIFCFVLSMGILAVQALLLGIYILLLPILATGGGSTLRPSRLAI